jgi:hypothetical protein
MAPSRPLPSGVDSVKFVAGASNQIVVSGAKFFSEANKDKGTAAKMRTNGHVSWCIFNGSLKKLPPAHESGMDNPPNDMDI